jgi:hypothetical protein
MREATLRDFFLGLAPVERVASEAAGATEQSGPSTRKIHVQDLEAGQEFEITAPMLVRLCDAVLRGELPGTSLEPISFAVIASDHLGWAEGDDLVGRVLHAWASPEINWELTRANVQMFRGWLTGAIEPPPEARLDPNSAHGRLISTTMKARLPPQKDSQPKDEA